MDSARRVIAILMLVTVPPAVIYWYVIHPLAAFWRGLGARTTFLLIVPPLIGLGVLLYHARSPLLGTDLGTNWWLIGIGAPFYLLAVFIEVQCRRHLKFPILAGVPEVSRGGGPGTLLQRGIYGRLRHPRYLGFLLGVMAAALIVNYAGMYLLWLVTLPSLALLIWLEEKELLDRFGADYRNYRSRVPCIIPRLSRSPEGNHE